MRMLGVVLATQLLLGGIFLVLVATGALNALDGEERREPDPKPAPERRVDRFDEDRAFAWLRRQVELGPRPAGSRASRELARQIEEALPRGRFQPVPGGLRNVVGVTPGRDRDRVVVVGAHYDTKDIPGFVGANDGASGVATMLELARGLEPRAIDPTVVWIAFDGEESPGPHDSGDFERRGLRGSKVAARTYDDAEAMVLLDFVGDRELSFPREANSDPELWSRLRAAARRTGNIRHFPDATRPPISDDHVPFLRRGVPAIDLIDFDFECWHMICDDLSAVSKASLDVTGETVRELLASL